MSYQVWKFVVEAGQFAVDMPYGAEILTVEQIGEKPFMWAKVNTTAPVVEHRFVTVGTGHDMPFGGFQKYIGTFFQPQWGLVWHLFDEGVCLCREADNPKCPIHAYPLNPHIPS